jgi:hypothetical protein
MKKYGFQLPFQGLPIIVALLPAFACAASAPRLDLTPAQWHEDLEFVARELPRRHLNAFHTISSADFNLAVADLDRRLPQLNSDEVFVGLEHLIRLVGDGHTGLIPPPDSGDLPLRIRRFGDEWRVIQTTADFSQALGLKVLGIGGVSMAEAHARMLGVTPVDETQELRDSNADRRLSVAIFLRGLGLSPNRHSATFNLLTEDDHKLDLLVTVPQDAKREWQYAAESIPLMRQHPDDPLWCVRLQVDQVLYCNFRSYENLSGPAKSLRQALQAAPPTKLIIDLRQNGGGDYFVGLHQLVDPIAANPQINRQGHLFVLIGVQTFSAAMSNAAHFRERTAAILVGEPIGERPNSYQEKREVTLPNSHLVMTYSTKLYTFVAKEGENRISPDVLVPTSWSDFKAGRDPVLEYVMAAPSM